MDFHAHVVMFIVHKWWSGLFLIVGKDETVHMMMCGCHAMQTAYVWVWSWVVTSTMVTCECDPGWSHVGVVLDVTMVTYVGVVLGGHYGNMWVWLHV